MGLPFSWGANFCYFRGRLGSHEIFPPTKINAYSDMESMMMGVATKIAAAQPVLASKSSLVFRSTVFIEVL